tara:strand:+ start:128 stop:442 length:315 start_codon:yes stop_codon:yes gene_type:complete
LHSDKTISEVFKDFDPNVGLTEIQCEWLCKRFTFHFTNAESLKGHQRFGTAPSRNPNNANEGDPHAWHCTAGSHPRLGHLPPLPGLAALTWSQKLALMISKYIF